MIVTRQDVADALGAHRLHENAIGEAIALVEAGFVEGQAVKERWRV
jgi:hypothetical protein